MSSSTSQRHQVEEGFATEKSSNLELGGSDGCNQSAFQRAEIRRLFLEFPNGVLEGGLRIMDLDYHEYLLSNSIGHLASEPSNMLMSTVLEAADVATGAQRNLSLFAVCCISSEAHDEAGRVLCKAHCLGLQVC